MNNVAADQVSSLKRFCVCIVEFLSSQAIDPHLYFQQKLTGEIAGRDSVDDLIEMLRQLMGWADTLDFRPDQSERLDAMLADQGFPPISELKAATDGEILIRLNPTE
jgi:hypothetical protein